MSAGLTGVLFAVLAGALRISTPFLFVSLGETLTEKSGRVNLGLEGTLVMGAMGAYGISYLTGSPWLGVLAAGGLGVVLGSLHAWLCSRPRVNDVAVGIAMMLFGVGLAFFLGKPLIGPTAKHLPAIPFGFWSSSPQVRSDRSIPSRRISSASSGRAATPAWCSTTPSISSTSSAGCSARGRTR